MCHPVGWRRPRLKDEEEFLRLAKKSRSFLRPWISPPVTPDAYHAYVRASRKKNYLPYVLFSGETNEIVGVVNASEIVRGVFQSTYLGYYVFAPFARRGLMTSGMSAVLDDLFGPQQLHRAEANIQPDNTASIALVKRLGLQREGYSPRYLKIAGQWRDHERWAIRKEDWKRPRL